MKLASLILVLILLPLLGRAQNICPNGNGQDCIPYTSGTACTTGKTIQKATSGWTCVDPPTGGGGAVFSVFGRTGDVVAAANDYSWAQIASKPSTFPPDAHGHTEADVTNLVTDLAAKVPTSRRIDTTTPLQGGDNLTADRTFSILQAGSGQSGYLSATDWSLFNAKENGLTFSSPLSRSVNTITCPTCSVSGHGHAAEDVTSGVFGFNRGGTNQTAWNAAKCVRVNDAGTALEPAAADCGTGGGAVWGAITGTLSNQTDLQGALDGKSATGHGHVESDVTNLVTDLAAKEATANKNAASGYAGLDASTKLAAAQLPNPAPTTLGGIKSSACSGNDKVTGIDTSGAATCGTDQATGTGPTFARVTADVQNTTVTFANVTGLTFAVAINTNTSFACELFYTTAATTTALQLAINGPASPTAMRYAVRTSTTATAMHSASQSAYDTNTNPGTGGGTTALPVRISGTLENGGTAGTLAIRFRSEVAASAVNVLRGSFCAFVTY